MELLVPITLVGWPLIAVIFFAWLPTQRAVIFCFVVGWLFLPSAHYSISGLPDYSKVTATSLGALVGIALTDGHRLLSYKPNWLDAPIIIWCFCPLATSMVNKLGLYDGLSESFAHVMTWWIPYAVGRLYFRTFADLRELAIGIVCGGLIYIPLCLFEARMSPQLYSIVYGFKPRAWNEWRLGGWRPNVFMETGLALGMWMSATSLTGIWLWTTGAVRRIHGISMHCWIPILLLTTIICRSIGALVLLFSGVAALVATKWHGTAVLILGLVIFAPTYVFLRSSGFWAGDNAVSIARSFVTPARAQSLEFRFRNEDILVARALQRPVFGWGGWGRNRVHDDQGRDVSVTDGRWIIAVGRYGLVGLISLGAALLLPPFLLWRRLDVTDWSRPEIASVAALTLVIVLWTVDNLLNDMENPIFVLGLGGVASLAWKLMSEKASETDTYVHSNATRRSLQTFEPAREAS